MIDVGLFPNSNPRNFTQIEPRQKDEKSREDKLRSAPKLNLSNFQEYITTQNLAIDIHQKLETPDYLIFTKSTPTLAG